MKTRWQARMQSAVFVPKARSKVRFWYAGAERMCLHGKWLAGAYAKCRFQTLRHGVKSAFGMPARSACASMANGWQARMQSAVFVPKARSKVRFWYAGAERMCLHGKWWGLNTRLGCYKLIVAYF
jgi:hypothetical protein